MNIQTLANNIKLFQNEVINSGFSRDIQDYINSLPNNQNNIVSLRDIANKVNTFLKELHNSDLPESLNQLLPHDTILPFTEGNNYDLLSDLIEDKEVVHNQFFQRLNQILVQLNQQIQQNLGKINEIEQFIKPYIKEDTETISEENKAIVSIIFKEKQTISNLKYFTKNIQNWNRTLPIYYQILKSSSPKDIEILNVQNGSIDFVFNFDFDFAINLIDLFKEGFKYYLAYLSYRAMTKPIAQTFLGNKLLIKKQKEIETGMLDNIGIAITEQIKKQHKIAIKIDSKIDDKIDKKVEQVAKLVTSHIINGNDIKLLSLPEFEEDDKKNEELKAEIRQVSTEVRNKLKGLPDKEFKKLLEKYGKFDDNIE